MATSSPRFSEDHGRARTGQIHLTRKLVLPLACASWHYQLLTYGMLDRQDRRKASARGGRFFGPAAKSAWRLRRFGDA
jgi:hypothetical protein